MPSQDELDSFLFSLLGTNAFPTDIDDTTSIRVLYAHRHTLQSRRSESSGIYSKAAQVASENAPSHKTRTTPKSLYQDYLSKLLKFYAPAIAEFPDFDAVDKEFWSGKGDNSDITKRETPEKVNRKSKSQKTISKTDETTSTAKESNSRVAKISASDWF